MRRTPVDQVLGVLCIVFGGIALLAMIAPMSDLLQNGLWKEALFDGLLFVSIGTIIYRANRTLLFVGTGIAFIVGLAALFFAIGLIPIIFVLGSYMLCRALGLFQGKS